MEEQIQFESDGILLVGTLQFPDTDPPYPACLLLGGSGPQLRDGSFDYSRQDYFPKPLFKRPILEIEASALAEVGVASLRYDKRGSGESGGEIAYVSFSELVGDAESAMRYLADRRELDQRRIGIVGQSEGAAVGIMLASRIPMLAFYVWQSGFVDNFEELGRIQQNGVTAMPSELAEEMRSVAPYFYWEAISQSEIFEAARAGRETITIGDNVWSLELGLGYYRELMALDLLDSIAGIQCPVLIVHGEADDIVPVENARRAHQVLTDAGNDDVTLILLPEVGHSLNRLIEREANDSPQLEILPDQKAVNVISRWILDQVANSRAQSR